MKELTKKLNVVKNEIGLVNGTLKLNEYDDLKQNVMAGINPYNWGIEIKVKKGFNPVKDKRQKAYARAKKIENGLEKLLENVLHHEGGHWELPFGSGFGCPYDIYNHDLILEAVKDSLPEDKKSQAKYVANAFEDVIVNARCKEFLGDFSGQVLFWDDQGLLCKEEGKENFTPFYEAFVKLNMHLIGDGKDRALLKRHYSNNKIIDDAVQKVVENLKLQENIKNTSSLFIKKDWCEMASLFAKDLADLLEVSPIERLSAFSNEDSGNGIEQKLGTKEGKEEVAYGRYKGDKEQSPNIQSHEQLDSLYRRLSRAIPVQVEAMTRKQSLKIAPLNYRKFDEETDDINKIKLSKLFMDEGGLKFGYPKEHITVEEKSKIQIRNFPDFKMVLLDNSGSMAQGINGDSGSKTFIPWGDNSKYHYALLGFCGIENFLQAQGIAQYIGHGLSLFSSTTRYKESDFQNVHELRKLALSPEFGVTRLDAGDLLKSLEGKESFVLSISDGEIDNWSSVKGKFEDLASNNYFAHIQIGSGNEFTRDLEENNLPVFYVNNGEELSKLMVNVTTNTYRRFTQR